MGKKRRILLAMLPVALLAWFAWQMMKQREPVYEGKPLGVWLEGYDPSNRDAPIGRWEADLAVRQIGTDAIPTLLRMLQARDSAVKLKLIAVAQRRHLIRIKHIPAALRNWEAVRGFEELGARASNAVPALIEMYDRDESSQWLTRWEIGLALGYIGPPAMAAIPSLLRGASDPNSLVRGGALSGLGGIHARAEMVVPILTKSLSDPDAACRATAAGGLQNFGATAKSAVSALVQSLEDRDPVARAQAEGALKKIDPEAAAKAGVR
jgi:HEAT repeat protein